MNIPEMTEKMIAYFTKCIKQARGEYIDPITNRLTQKTKRIVASPAGLCIELGISKDKLFEMRGGTEEEQKFFSDFLLWYEEAGGAMLAGGVIDNGTFRQIKELCKAQSVEAENMFQVIFSNWNAPDDWEDYKELKTVLDANSLTWGTAVQIIEDFVKGDAGNAADNH